MILCTCCLAEITKPVFYKGAAYGSSCFKQQFDSKPTKIVKANFVKPESFELVKKACGFKVIAIFEGKKYIDSYYTTNDGSYIWEKSLTFRGNRKSKRFTFMQGNEDEIFINIQAFEDYKKHII